MKVAFAGLQMHDALGSKLPRQKGRRLETCQIEIFVDVSSLELGWFVSVFLNSIVVVFFIGETVVAFFVFQD